MTSLILFGTIIILLGIIIVCFYNKSFEINEGFRRNRNPPQQPQQPMRILKQKPVHFRNGNEIPYRPNEISGYVKERQSDWKYYWVLYGY